MGEIKSAIDIAMEKTAHIEGDAASSASRDLKNRGKRAAGLYLESGDEASLQKELIEGSKAGGLAFLEGVVTILLSQVKLPSSESDLPRIERIGTALELALPGKGMTQLFAQVAKILAQYIEERAQVRTSLEQQYTPKLRAKQQELARRYGQNVPLDLNQDPEFLAAYSKTLRMVDQKYASLVEEIRSRVRDAAGMNQEE